MATCATNDSFHLFSDNSIASFSFTDTAQVTLADISPTSLQQLSYPLLSLLEPVKCGVACGGSSEPEIERSLVQINSWHFDGAVYQPLGGIMTGSAGCLMCTGSQENC